MLEFKDNVYIVTGAANGQGAAEARLITELGGIAIITDIDQENGLNLANSLDKAIFVSHDVSSEEQWINVLNVAKSSGRIKGLINNAGIYKPASILDTSPEDFIKHFNVNQLGCFLGLKHVIPLLQENEGGSIVNIGSTAGVVGSSMSFAYCSTKWAMRGMSKAVAKEFGPSNIRVNTILPGPIATGMIDIRTEEQNAARMKSVPLRRFGSAEEVADLAIYLLSDKARFMTGAEILIDGGVTL